MDLLNRLALPAIVDGIFVAFALSGDLPPGAPLVLVATQGVAFLLWRRELRWLGLAIAQGAAFGVVLELLNVLVDDQSFETRGAVIAGCLYGLVTGFFGWREHADAAEG